MATAGTVNIFEGNKHPSIGLDAMQRASHFYGVQEATNQLIRNQVTGPGWSAIWPGSTKPETLPGVHLPAGWENAANAIPIAFRSSMFRVAGAGYFFAHPGQHAVTPHRGTAWALLLDQSNVMWPVINWHTISQAWPGSAHVYRERQARWLTQMKTINILVNRLLADHGRVVALGDLNRFNYRFDAPLRTVAVNGLDYIAVAGDVKAASSRVLLNLNSGDSTPHKGVVIPLATSKTPSKPPSKPPVVPPKEPVVLTRGICPFAIQKPVRFDSSDPLIEPRVAVLHVDGGNSSSLYPLFSHNQDPGGSDIESHIFILKNGDIEQYRNIFRQADANYLANPFAVSIETQGYGAGEWTAQQIASIKRFLTWLNTETKGAVPLRKIDKWDGSGVGYHIQFGSPGKWTNRAKVCPGSDRIKQYNADIIPWMSHQQEEDDMFTDADRKMLAQIAADSRTAVAQHRLMLTKVLEGQGKSKAEILAALAAHDAASEEMK